MSRVQQGCLIYLCVTVIVGCVVSCSAKTGEGRQPQAQKQEDAKPRFEVIFNFNGTTVSTICNAKCNENTCNMENCDDGYSYATIHGVKYKFHPEAK